MESREGAADGCMGSREDVKCTIHDDRPRDEGEGPPFICVRGSDGCEQALKFAKLL